MLQRSSSLFVVALFACAPLAAAETPQPRPHTTRIAVAPALVEVDDGDTVVIRWSPADVETIRILGIDAPETRHLEHNLPYAQPFGDEAGAFALGAFAAAGRISTRSAARSATCSSMGATTRR